MPVYISLLRAINVGGRNKIKMDDLRGTCQSAGLTQPRTHLQSGNVVFASEETDALQLSQRIEDAIEQSHGFRPEVIIRTAAEFKDVLQRDPFPKARREDPSHLLVMFLSTAPRDEAVDGLLQRRQGPEKMIASGRELFLYYPNGIGRSKLTNALVESQLKRTGTARNWNTVTKLLEIAEQI